MMKERSIRISLLLVTLCLVLFLLPGKAQAANTVASGTCGDNVTWVLDSEGTLNISGSGAMLDFYCEKEIPWFSYRTDIYNVFIQPGVTSISSSAFSWCSSLISITIPEGLPTSPSQRVSHPLS